MEKKKNLWSFTWQWLMLLLVLTLTAAPCPILAHNQDPDNPTPWPAEGINTASDGQAHIHYYIMDAGPGTLDISVRLVAGRSTTSVTVDLFDNSQRDNSLMGAGGTIFAGASYTDAKRLTLSERRTILVKLQMQPDVRDYGVQITGPVYAAGSGTGGSGETSPPGEWRAVEEVAWSSVPQGQIKASGDGRAVDQFYSVDAGPGDLIVDLVGEGGAALTAVRVEVIDSAHRTIADIMVAAPPGEQRYQQTRVPLSERQILHLRLRTDADTAHYILNLRGSIHR